GFVHMTDGDRVPNNSVGAFWNSSMRTNCAQRVIRRVIRRTRVLRGAAMLLSFAMVLPDAIVHAQQRAALADAVKQFVTVDDRIVALTHVRVIDGTGNPAKDDQTVVLIDGKITAVGAASSAVVPASARVLDLHGQTVVPGFVGMHEHTYFYAGTQVTQMSLSAPRLYLANGVTTIRTTGSYFPYVELNMKHAIANGSIAGPRMHITGPYLNGGVAPSRSYERFVNTEEETRRVVAYWAAEGATWFKFLGNVSRHMLEVAIDEAHKHGAKVTAHLCSVTFREAAALGIDNVEHGFITDSDFVPDKQPDICPADNMKAQKDVDVNSTAVRASIAELVKRGVAVTSTLSVYELFVQSRARLDPRALEALSPETRRVVEQSHADANEFPVSAELFAKMMQYDRAFVRAGGLLVSGVDPWGNGSVPGYGNLRNYELFIEEGFTAEESIRIMSANGAKLLGELAERGTIEVGKIADLAIINGNPVLKPADIYNVSLVFRDGIGYDSAKLIASVKGQIGIR
ncbi:MAG: amidohydrolase family protein, partial [Gemmatimonadaceae bacterium]